MKYICSYGKIKKEASNKSGNMNKFIYANTKKKRKIRNRGK